MGREQQSPGAALIDSEEEKVKEEETYDNCRIRGGRQSASDGRGLKERKWREGKVEQNFQDFWISTFYFGVKISSS